VHFPVKQPGQDGLAPFLLSLGMRPLLQRRDLVEPLATVGVVQTLHHGGDLGEDLLLPVLPMYSGFWIGPILIVVAQNAR